jgi:hypothetical protein
MKFELINEKNETIIICKTCLIEEFKSTIKQSNAEEIN